MGARNSQGGQGSALTGLSPPLPSPAPWWSWASDRCPSKQATAGARTQKEGASGACSGGLGLCLTGRAAGRCSLHSNQAELWAPLSSSLAWGSHHSGTSVLLPLTEFWEAHWKQAP